MIYDITETIDLKNRLDLAFASYPKGSKELQKQLEKLTKKYKQLTAQNGELIVIIQGMFYSTSKCNNKENLNKFIDNIGNLIIQGYIK